MSDNRKKMIFLDLDGTLLNDREEISEYNKKVLQKVSQHAYIVLSSARGIYRISKYTDQLSLNSGNNFTIAYNGSYVIRNDGEILINAPISDLSAMRRFINDNLDSKWILYSENQRYHPETTDDIFRFLDENTIYKIGVADQPDRIREMEDNLSEELRSAYEATSTAPNLLQFVEKGHTKMQAIKYLLDITGLKREDTIAFGDAENDLEMIRFAKTGVAMANGDPALKKEADLIADSNNNDGVGRMLEELFK